MFFDISRFRSEIICEDTVCDTVLRTETKDNGLEVFLKADNDRPKFIRLFWEINCGENMKVLGDAFERSYGDLEFRNIEDNDRFMPWYFIATDGDKSFCLGVKTGCSSFVSFRCEKSGITALIDVRNGGNGVELNSRELHAATFICKEYNGESVFSCLCDFCREMCDKPVLPSFPVYGGNNWYYAYGKSSFEEIVSDARFQSELSAGIENRPFEVIDDCWQINRCDGPWLPNKKFGDMKKLADEIRSAGARPGIWVRLLSNPDSQITDDMRILRDGKREYLDPTHPLVKKLIKDDISRIKSWGYELLKHDFSTVDMFGDFGKKLTDTITNYSAWGFYDRTKTSAEIVLDFYRLIKECCGDMLVIGCNTVSHLSAGIFEIYRTGDDTSGRNFESTKRNGVNTLAFRLAQNRSFYLVDADCVGIKGRMIPWSKNRQWLELLSYSNTAFFISCNNKISKRMRADIENAYKVFQEEHELIPLSLTETRCPEEWLADGEALSYKW